MKKLLLLLLLSLGFISSANATVPSYITVDTFDNICRKVNCQVSISDYYKKNYYTKQFYKALAISYTKSGNRYSINYGFFAWQYPNSAQAKTAALRGCKKNGRNCEIFLVNNSYANADLYYKLTNSTSSSSYSSSSSNKIPANAYASGSGWKCNSGYTKSGNSRYCVLLPNNAYATGTGWECNSGYWKSGYSCIWQPKRTITIPANAHSSGGGWICNTDYYRNSSLTGCLRVPANASSSYSSNYWKCNSGYSKTGNSCTQSPADDKLYKVGSGSGFAVTADGYIVTNHHVINGCTQVSIYDKGKSFIATVVTKDPVNDLAVLKSDFRPSAFYPLSTEINISSDIFAAGYPFGMKISSSVKITKGIISTDMGLGDDISRFQIDADLNPGNSGGPIVDKRGNVVGVAVARWNADEAIKELGEVPEGMYYAIKSMMVKAILQSVNIKFSNPNKTILSEKDRALLFKNGTFYLSCSMSLAQYQKMEKTNKVMFTKEVIFNNLN